jgi:hypothetical protein
MTVIIMMGGRGLVVVKFCREKYCLFTFEPKSPVYLRHPVPKEGRFAIVTDVGAGCGGRGSVGRA